MASDLFFAKLNGQSYYDLYNKVINLDRSVTSFNDRLKNVKKLLGNKSYIVTYFSKYYDSHLSKMNHLSTGNNICHLVEMLANYLLMTDEVKAIDGREKTYYVDSNRLNRQNDKPGDIKEKYGKNNIMIVQFNRSNYKIDKKVKIRAKDFDHSWCGHVLSDQQAGINEATYKMHHHLANNYRLSHMKHELRADQISTKIHLHGIFDLNNFNSDSSADDYYATLSDPTVVKYMLKMPHCSAINKTATWLLWLDLKSLLTKVKFQKSEYYVLGLYSLGWSYSEIGNKYRNNDGKLHPVSKQYIGQIMSKLFNRIAQVHHQILLKRISHNKEFYI